ncbi:MAG: hypothetical protein ACXWQQ_12260 [Pseudobdellovibrio sp.]
MKYIAILITIAFSLNLFASETSKGIKKDYEKFKQEATVKLEKLDQKIAELKEKAKASGSQTKDATIQDLEQAKAKLQADLDEAQASSSSKWRSFKKSFSKSISELNAKIQNALKDDKK